MERLLATSDRVDLWHARPEELLGESVRERALKLLAPEEQVRLEQFRQPKDRLLYLAGKVLTRMALSRYAAVPPGDWRFVAGPHGKPRLSEPGLESLGELSFNLSHTRGMVAVAVARATEVGVDVEDAARSVSLDVARRFFSAVECEQLASTPVADQPRVFLAFWTLKEAYIKAKGLGLNLPLADFAFDLSKTREVTIQFAPWLEDDPSRWWFARPEFAWPGHAVGVAVGGFAAEVQNPPRLVVRQMMLAGEGLE